MDPGRSAGASPTSVVRDRLSPGWLQVALSSENLSVDSCKRVPASGTARAGSSFSRDSCAASASRPTTRHGEPATVGDRTAYRRVVRGLSGAN